MVVRKSLYEEASPLLRRSQQGDPLRHPPHRRSFTEQCKWKSQNGGKFLLRYYLRHGYRTAPARNVRNRRTKWRQGSAEDTKSDTTKRETALQEQLPRVAEECQDGILKDTCGLWGEDAGKQCQPTLRPCASGCTKYILRTSLGGGSTKYKPLRYQAICLDAGFLRQEKKKNENWSKRTDLNIYWTPGNIGRQGEMKIRHT
ncbi:hypothetical protein MGYG_06263 [Nannizzia gypsea CBS 118893]|uniref:Uncharacterized protein n=1 Tax=Arthroderma gypseum (strain ATCC MYA-4604 / CBS 118893) TaxID=535722 RepID=E4UYT1_ARTGP|nr:hypothetical protein MGYG_06263 [Nannizzia gypsea CBS 118893]EFR03261.1 hypothetical protein MGYG_06263 [Nannizzia gypsea CBS 118893]